MNADIRTEKSRNPLFPGLILVSFIVCLFSCKQKKPEVHDIVKSPAELKERVRDNINTLLDYPEAMRQTVRE
ncbi:MAG: hypothetical protein ABI415_11360, partial [Flavitalea sp.]